MSTIESKNNSSDMGCAGLKQFLSDLKLLLDPCVWIFDTGAYVHANPHKQEIKKVDETNLGDNITGISGAEEKAAMIAHIPGVLCDNPGNDLEAATIDKLNHIPTTYFNLFSGTKMLKNSCTMQGDMNKIALTKGNCDIVLAIKIPTKKEVIFLMYHRRSTEIAGAAMDVGTKMSMTKAHILLSHGNADQTRNTENALGWLLIYGMMPPCGACAQAKAK